VHQWGRGVDTRRFTPSKRDAELRARLAPRGELLVGYVGRLAPEKQLERLAALAGLPGTRLVVVGSGPAEKGLRTLLPGAAFLGFRDGDDLARTYASLDVFVHTGPSETFCQAVQEALASGLPVVAPDAGGPRDLVLPGRTGFLVPPRPVDGDGAAADAGLVAAVRALADPSTREVRRRRPSFRTAAHLVRGVRRAARPLRRRPRRPRAPGGVVRIVQLANFYGPRSGGLRTALHHLGAGYTDRGHEVVLVVPGRRSGVEELSGGVRRYTIAAPQLPGTGGYRAVDPWRVRRLLHRLAPDALEVSDRLTLRGLGRWARRQGLPAVVVSHERLDRLLAQFLLPAGAARRCADAANARMAQAYDTVVCTTAFARAEFDRIGAPNVVQVPLGVDLATFSPRHRDGGLRAELAAGADTVLVHCGRLSPEKHPERSVDTVAALRAAGHSVRLVVAGDGPRRPALQRRAAGLPVTFVGFVPDRSRLARLLASADVSLAPGPHETFGLSALEALASGTPVVVSASSALPEIVDARCGATAADSPAAFAAGVATMLAAREPARRAARARAEQFSWPAAVDRMLSTFGAANSRIAPSTAARRSGSSRS